MTNINNLNGLYLFVETFKELSIQYSLSYQYKDLLLEIYQGGQLFQKRTFKPTSGEISLYDTSVNTLYTDILEGELKELFYFTNLVSEFQLPVDKKKIINFVLSLQNKDGGFGNIRDSQISTTFYALNILALFDYPLYLLKGIRQFLHHQWLKTNYLEDLYWLVESLSISNLVLPPVDQLTLFLYDCSRDNGGFSRSRNLGIPTIEYTHQAVSLLKILGQI